MTRRVDAAWWAVPSIVTLGLLASRLFAVPALSDPVAGPAPASLYLSVPGVYLVLAPWFTIWDGISMLSWSRLQGFLTGLAALYLIWRVVRYLRARRPARRWPLWAHELGVLLLALGATVAFLITGAVWHRPMLALAGVPAEERVVDFHSHTRLSHDVGDTWMRGFNRPANLRWHARAGFDAAFITDHNVVSRESRVAGRESELLGRQSPVIRRQSGAEGSTVTGCPGIEVSAWQSHIVLLGDTLPVKRELYSSSLSGLLSLLRTSEAAYGALTVASLPEYRRNHWNRLDSLVAAGLDGFEIVNASPKANELPRSERERVIALARHHNLFVVGVSDSHGWGATSMVWNLVRVLPGTVQSGLCGAILGELHEGYSAVRVVERHRLRPESPWPLWLTPLGMLWETWRSMGWPLTVSWLVWVWLLWSAPILLRTVPSRAKIAR
jgi:hypothetical protein